MSTIDKVRERFRAEGDRPFGGDIKALRDLLSRCDNDALTDLHAHWARAVTEDATALLCRLEGFRAVMEGGSEMPDSPPVLREAVEEMLDREAGRALKAEAERIGFTFEKATTTLDDKGGVTVPARDEREAKRPAGERPRHPDECVECERTCVPGSGRFVNRIPADRDDGTVGWLCGECLAVLEYEIDGREGSACSVFTPDETGMCFECDGSADDHGVAAH